MLRPFLHVIALIFMHGLQVTFYQSAYESFLFRLVSFFFPREINFAWNNIALLSFISLSFNGAFILVPL